MADGLYSKRPRAQYGGPTTSDKYNERVSNNFKDLSLLYNRIGIAEERMIEVIRQHHKNISSLDKAISLLEGRVDALDTPLFIPLDEDDTNRFNSTAFDVIEADRLEVSPRYGTVSLRRIASGSESRIRYQDDEGNSYLPSSLQAVARGVAETADDSEAVINESSILNSFLNKTGRVWERNVVVGGVDADGAAVEIFVALPVEIAQSLRVNKIILEPFPSRGVDIEYVGYSTKSSINLNNSDDYRPINDKSLYTNNQDAVGFIAPGAWNGDEIHNAGAVAFEFDPIDITAIKVRLSTKNYYIEDGNYVYTYGLSSFDIRSEKHLDEGTSIFKVELPEGETVSSVNDVNATLFNVNPIEAQEIFDYRIIWETSYDSGVYTLDPVPFSTRFWVEVTLRKTANGGTPILSSLDVEYS